MSDKEKLMCGLRVSLKAEGVNRRATCWYKDDVFSPRKYHYSDVLTAIARGLLAQACGRKALRVRRARRVRRSELGVA